MSRGLFALVALVAAVSCLGHAAPATGSAVDVMVVNVGAGDSSELDVSVSRAPAAKEAKKDGAGNAAGAAPKWLVVCSEGCTVPAVTAALAGHDPAAPVAVSGVASMAGAPAGKRALLQASFDNDFTVNPDFSLGGRKGGDDGSTIHGVKTALKPKRAAYDVNWREKESKARIERKKHWGDSLPSDGIPLPEVRRDPVQMLKEAAEGGGAFAKIAQSMLESKGKANSELAITSGFRYERTRKHFEGRLRHQKKGIGGDLDRLSAQSMTGEAYRERERARAIAAQREAMAAPAARDTDGMRRRHHRRSLRERRPAAAAAERSAEGKAPLPHPAADVVPAEAGAGVVVGGVRPGEFMAMGAGLLRSPSLEHALAEAGGGGALADGMRSPRALRELLGSGGVEVVDA